MSQAGGQLRLENIEEGGGHPLAELDHDVAGEAVAHHHVGHAGGDILALHVADEVEGRWPSSWGRRPGPAALPLVSSSPLLRSPTLGLGMPKTLSM